MWQFRREIALSVAGLLATLLGFMAGAAWGWRVLGGFMLLAAAFAFVVGQAAFLVPGFKAGYLSGKAAVSTALIGAAIGLAVVMHAKELAVWSCRACSALHLLECESDGACASRDRVAIASPSRSVRAVKFVRSCGPGARLTTEVSLVAMGDPLQDEPGNVFIVDGTADLVLFWIEGKHLAISGVGPGTPRVQNTYVKGVRISYQDRTR